MKICSKCKIEKGLDFFYKRKDTIDGYRTDCKECKDLISKNYKIEKIEKISEYQKNYRNKNKEIYSEYNRKYYLENRDEINDSNNKWRENNKERVKSTNDRYQEGNKEKILEHKREYYNLNKDKIKEYRVSIKDYLIDYNREYSKKNRNEINEKRREKIKNSPLEKLKSNIRCSITSSFKSMGFNKKNLSEKIIGCQFEDLKKYLESKFDEWMSWDNKGLYNGELNYGWDIDHIIPLSSANTEEDVFKLNHYKNLQPLCSYINRNIKRDRLDYKKNYSVINY